MKKLAINKEAGKIQKVITNRAVYTEYVKAGLWVPLETVKYYRNGIGVVKAQVSVKVPGNTHIMREVVITINNYFL